MANAEENSEVQSEHTLHNDHDHHHESTSDEERDVSDGGEKGEESKPQPVGFWHKSLASTRMKAFQMWARTTLILASFILTVLSLYWAVLYRVETNLNSLIVHVVNFETDPTAIIGPAIVQMTEGIVRANKMPHLGYTTMPPSYYNNDPMQVRESIYNQEAWAAIIINANATSSILQAVRTGDSKYDPLGAAQIIYVQTREQDTFASYITPQLDQLQIQASSMVGQKLAGQFLNDPQITRQNLAKVPQALSPGIGFSVFNLRPFLPAVATPAVTVGLIYLIILAFFSVPFFMPIHMTLITPGKDHGPLKFWQFIVWRIIATITAYFFMSLAYSLVSVAFQIPFSNPPAPYTEVATNANAFGRASFLVYWMLNWVGMGALGFACENVAMIVGQPWTAFWLIFWVISNVSTSFYSIDLAPGFFKYGYAFPLHNVVEGSRTIIFDTYNHLGTNFGVLFGWIGVNLLFFPLCCLFMRKMSQRQKKKENEKKED